MARARSSALLTACVLLAARVSRVATQSEHVDANERIQLDSFQGKVNELCTDSFAGRDELEDQRVEARQQLVDGVGGENWILDILKESSGDDIGEKAEEKVMDVSFILNQTYPLILMLVTCIVYSCCCWSACCCCWRGKPCHKCCRCPGRCAKKRTTNTIVKIVGLLLVVAIVGLTAVSAMLAINGYEKISDGFDNFACTSATLTDNMLNGKTTDGGNFIGVVPLLDAYAGLIGQLEDGSQLVQDVDTIIESTQSIDTSLQLASATLALMSNTLAENRNVMPMGTDGSTFYHTCTICEQLPGILQPIITALDEGAGASLRDARAEVRDQLSSQNRADLRANLGSTSDPLAEVKNTLFATTVTFFEDDGMLMTMRDNLTAEAGLGISIGIFIMLLFGLCGCGASGCFVVKENKGDAGPNPCIHRTSCCVWCAVLPCSAILFFVGGLLMLISSPLCGLCLIMDDLDSQLLNDISPAMGLDLETGDSMAMTLDIIDKCFAAPVGSDASNLMDILFVVENGERKYVRQILVDDVTSQITGQFDEVAEQLGSAGDGESLADSEGVQNLVALLTNNPAAAMIVPSQQQAEDLATQYPGLAAAGGDLATGFATSVSCDDHTPSSDFDDSQTAIPGLQSFITSVHTECGCTGGAPTCPAVPVGCGTGTGCADAVLFLGEKYELMTTPQLFRCDLFEHPSNGGLTCDVKDMVATGGGSYNNDCMRNGAWTPKEVFCNLDEFNQYLADFGARITNVLTRVDNTVPLVAESINDDLRSVTDTYVIAPMNDIVNQATCGFLTEAYRNMVGGLCYQGVRGMRMVGIGYTMAAILGLFMAIFMYAYWRRSVDNWNSFLDEKEGK